MQHKAGMDDCNMDEIGRKVYEISKDSDHYKRQQIKTAKANQKGKDKLKKIENYQQNEKLYSMKR
jgi:uncharacterized protein with ATP-grasp and redox domains